MADATAKLYSPSLLALSIELANFPHDPGKPLQGRATSKTCGSEVLISAGTTETGALAQLGMLVSACAVGQASAAIFADTVADKTAHDIENDLRSLRAWINGNSPSSILPRLDMLEPARDYPARHEAILLPWRAALDALA